MNARVSWSEDFLRTGLWVGIRIYFIPLLVFFGFFLFQDAARSSFDQAIKQALSPASKALVQIQSDLGGSPSSRSWMTPGAGAKWIRP